MQPDQFAARNRALSAPLPAALSPDQFPHADAAFVAGTGGAAPTADPDLTSADRATVASLLDQVRSARVDLRSADGVVVRSAKRRLNVALSYLAGLLDGRGITLAPAASGFGSVLGPRVPFDLDDALDELEAALETALLAPATRVTGWTSAMHAVGDAMISIGTGLIVAGIVGTVPA